MNTSNNNTGGGLFFHCGLIYFFSIFFRKDGTKVTTLIKRISGNKDIFVQELCANLRLPLPLKKNNKNNNNKHKHGQILQWKAGGTILEVQGNYTKDIKLWLAGLGF